MKFSNWKVSGLLVVPLLVAVLGCDSRGPVESSTTEATVKGTVTIQGKPASQGEVIFDPSNYQRKDVAARRAPIQEDGSYEVTTLIGYNMITISSEEAARADVSYVSLDYEVPRGESTFDIVLPPPAQ